MEANIQNLKSNLKTAHRKEKHFFKQLTLLHIADGEIREIAQLRFYQPKYDCYACFWINSKGASGSGRAGGGGYCKQSASAAYAINSAGIELSEAIDGRGIQAVESALLAIGEALGLKGCKVLTSHG